MASSEPDAVVDTVVLRYFLLVDEFDLLIELLGSPLSTSRIIYDPDEVRTTTDDAGLCEMGRSIVHQDRISSDPARDEEARAVAAQFAARLRAVDQLHAVGRLVVIDMDDDERTQFATLLNPHRCHEFGLRFPLDPGEAACIAIGVRRNLVVATDDNDALRALRRLAPEHPYERIRRLLIRAADDGRRSRKDANQIHSGMQRAGFWDRQRPFPD